MGSERCVEIGKKIKLRASAAIDSEGARRRSEALARLVTGIILLERQRAAEAAAELAGAVQAFEQCTDRDCVGLGAALVRTLRANVDLESVFLVALTARLHDATLLGKDDAAKGLLVDLEGKWFRPPSGTLIRCGARREVRLLLLALIEGRRDRPGVPLTVDELRDVGWSGEQMHVVSARNRIKQSMAVLRKLGLGELLLCRNGGYMLDPAVPLSISKRHDAEDPEDSFLVDRDRRRHSEIRELAPTAVKRASR